MNGEPDLEGLSALVTGATSGIGQAEELGRHGAEVIVHGRDDARGNNFDKESRQMTRKSIGKDLYVNHAAGLRLLL